MKKLLILLCMVAMSFSIVFFQPAVACADGKLDKFKQGAGLKKPKPSKSLKTPQKKNAKADFELDLDEEDDDDENFWNELVGLMLAEMFKAIARDISTDDGIRYRAYPYSKEKYAYYNPEKIPRVAGTLRTEYQKINSDLYGLTWRLTMRMPTSWNLSIISTHYDEKLNLGNHVHMDFLRVRLSRLFTAFGPTLPEELDESGAAGSFRLSESNLLIHGGVGFCALDGEAGLDIGIECDWFFRRPLALHVGVGHSCIGNGITDIDIGVGVMTGPFEFSAGYRWLITRGEKIDGVYFSIGFWF